MQLTASAVHSDRAVQAVSGIAQPGHDVADLVELLVQRTEHHRDVAPLGRRLDGGDTLRRTGIVVDLSRKRVELDGSVAAITFKEFELLQYLVLREGHTIDRAELIASLWAASDDEAPNERTIDVHVRRLRAKLEPYEAIVRTVRGVGYRFDRHADVVIRYGHGTPSPDRF